MKDKNNSKLIKNCIISGVIIIVVVLSIFLIFTLKKKTISNSEQLTKSLKEMGVQFYEDFYYNQIGKNEVCTTIANICDCNGQTKNAE